MPCHIRDGDSVPAGLIGYLGILLPILTGADIQILGPQSGLEICLGQPVRREPLRLFYQRTVLAHIIHVYVIAVIQQSGVLEIMRPALVLGVHDGPSTPDRRIPAVSILSHLVENGGKGVGVGVVPAGYRLIVPNFVGNPPAHQLVSVLQVEATHLPERTAGQVFRYRNGDFPLTEGQVLIGSRYEAGSLSRRLVQRGQVGAGLRPTGGQKQQNRRQQQGNLSFHGQLPLVVRPVS